MGACPLQQACGSQRGRTIPSLIGCPGILKANLIDRFLYSAKRGKERHLGGGGLGEVVSSGMWSRARGRPQSPVKNHIFLEMPPESHLSSWDQRLCPCLLSAGKTEALGVEHVTQLYGLKRATGRCP